MDKLNLGGAQNLKIERKICIQPIGNKMSDTVSEVISFLHQRLKNYFEEVVVLNLIRLHAEFNPVRQQFDSNAVLKSVKTVCDVNVGILEEDIYSRGFNFVFGIAEVGGRRAIVSICRLKPEFYGLKANSDLLNSRALKEVMHETGHVLGLRHCENSECVMHFSNSIVDTDIKSWDYCSKCLEKLKQTENRVK